MKAEGPYGLHPHETRQNNAMAGPHDLIQGSTIPNPGPNQSVKHKIPNPLATMINDFSLMITHPQEGIGEPGLLALPYLQLWA